MLPFAVAACRQVGNDVFLSMMNDACKDGSKGLDAVANILCCILLAPVFAVIASVAAAFACLAVVIQVAFLACGAGAATVAVSLACRAQGLDTRAHGACCLGATAVAAVTCAAVMALGCKK